MTFIDRVPPLEYLKIYEESGWASLSEEEYEFLRLEFCLKEDLYTPDEGALFLASAAPIISAPRWNEEGRYETLPGVYEFKDPLLSIEEYQFFLQKALRIPRCFVGEQAKSPLDFLIISLQNNHVPPWYSVLENNPEVMKRVLPNFSREKHVNPKSYAAKQRHEGDAQHEAKYKMLRAADERRARGAFNHALFKREMINRLAKHPNKLCEPSSIPRWMTEIIKDWNNAGCQPWITEARERSYDGFQSADSLLA